MPSKGLAFPALSPQSEINSSATFRLPSKAYAAASSHLTSLRSEAAFSRSWFMAPRVGVPFSASTYWV